MLVRVNPIVESAPAKPFRLLRAAAFDEMAVARSFRDEDRRQCALPVILFVARPDWIANNGHVRGQARGTAEGILEITRTSSAQTCCGYHRHRTLLRACRKRPRRRCAEYFEKFASPDGPPPACRLGSAPRTFKKYVSIIPLPLTSMLPRASKSKRSSNKARVAAEIWTRPGTEWDSMRLAVLTVSPQTS